MPVNSMTGYGSAEATTAIGAIRVEVRSVNNRYLEVSCYLPRQVASLEQKIKKLVSNSVARGSVTLSVNFERPEDNSVELKLNRPLAAQYVKIANELKKNLGVSGDLTVSELLHHPEIVSTANNKISEDVFFKHLKPVTEKALVMFGESRAKEGAFTLVEMKKILKNIEKVLGIIEKTAPARFKRQTAILKEKIEALAGKIVDPQRIATEVAILSDKLDIAEECLRLRSHIVKMRDDMADESEPLGKKMGFLLQEMNREANTIGSKANDAEIAHLAVSLKEDIEKIREQSLNIE